MTRIPAGSDSFQGDFRDPCAGIESDVSALLDGELNQSGLRRVLVHLEICPKCRGFLDSIRAQVSLHQQLHRSAGDPWAEDLVDADAGEDVFGEEDLFADVDADMEALVAPSALHQSILEDVRERVGEVLYQLGRAYVILARSPSAFRIIAKEPVPVPEYMMRGKALLDGVSTAEREDEAGESWDEARELLGGRLDVEQKNFDKGRRLLEESLSIRPASNAAAILLAQVLTETGHLDAARARFQDVLANETSRVESDPVTRVPYRIYALESLGNLHLCADENESALAFFEEVRVSGAMQIHADFSSCLLNIAVSALRLDDFERAAAALEECYRDFPDRREPIRQQLAMHRPMLRDLERGPKTLSRLATSCPSWFGDHGRRLRGAVSFHLESYSLSHDADRPRVRGRA